MQRVQLDVGEANRTRRRLEGHDAMYRPRNREERVTGAPSADLRSVGTTKNPRTRRFVAATTSVR
jgi:hypothetical protein